MADSFQNEVPNARINLKRDLHTGGVSKKTELPLKLLVAGDLSNGQESAPLPQVVETRLTIDGQELRYFNQMAGWQSFRWPGETYRPGTMLTWTTVNAGARLFGDYRGTWGFIRWLEQGERRQLDRSQWMMSFTAPDGRTLQWVLRSQLGSGPLALQDLRGFTLPDQIFSVDSAATAQALMASTENSDMEGVE